MPSHAGSQVRTTIAANIDRGIRERAMTNRAVGDAIGATEHQVWRWRRGKHAPGLDTLAALANVLYGGDITQFYVEDDEAA